MTLQEERARSLFQRLWSASVGKAAYDKAEWRTLDEAMSRAMRLQSREAVESILRTAESTHRFQAHDWSEYPNCCLAPIRIDDVTKGAAERYYSATPKARSKIWCAEKLGIVVAPLGGSGGVDMGVNPKPKGGSIP